MQENADKAFTYLSLYRMTDQRFLQLATDDMKTVTAAPMDKWAVGYEDRAE